MQLNCDNVGTQDSKFTMLCGQMVNDRVPLMIVTSFMFPHSNLALDYGSRSLGSRAQWCRV